jgi:alpha-beta hydrolase superfamily lysophospholipase
MLSGAATGGTVHTQVWFGPPERPLYGWVSTPAGGLARGGAILCPPMGEEGRAAHRTFRRLAEALAARGILALRFDYDGTGDSAGLQDDPDRVASWLASVEAARQLLLDLGAPDVSAVGMRLGATLAGCQAAASTPFRSLALWDPCLSGRTFLREGEALFALGEDDGRVHDDGLRHTPGFQYDAATGSDLRTVDLAKLPADRPLADRVLLLSRTDRPAAESIERRVRLEPGVVELRPATAQDQLLDRTPSDCYVPEEALASVVDWLVAGTDEVSVPVKAGEECGVRLASGAPGSAQVLERPTRIGPLGLYGIIDEPVTPSRTPWVVLVNVAAEHHIGPGRRWVEFARRWAGDGYRVVRIDQSGIGDSPSHEGQVEDEPFAPEWIDDMREVVRHLSADGSTVVVVGLCSGSYSAFEVALWEHVEAVFAVNPRLTLYPAAKGTHVYTPIRRAGILPAKPIATLALRHRILAGGLWRIYRQVAVWHGPFRVLRSVVKRGTAVHVSACHDDAQHFTEVLFWRPFLARLRRNPRFRFEQDEVFDHSLLSRAGQQATFERASDFLATYAALPDAGSAEAAS